MKVEITEKHTATGPQLVMGQLFISTVGDIHIVAQIAAGSYNLIRFCGNRRYAGHYSLGELKSRMDNDPTTVFTPFTGKATISNGGSDED